MSVQGQVVDEWVLFAQDTGKYMPEIYKAIGSTWGPSSYRPWNATDDEELESDNSNIVRTFIGVSKARKDATIPDVKSIPDDNDISDSTEIISNSPLLHSQSTIPTKVIFNLTSDNPINQKSFFKIKLSLLWKDLKIDENLNPLPLSSTRSGFEYMKTDHRKTVFSTSSSSSKNKPLDVVLSQHIPELYSEHHKSPIHIDKNEPSTYIIYNYLTSIIVIHPTIDTKENVTMKVFDQLLWSNKSSKYEGLCTTKDILVFPKSFVYIQFRFTMNSSTNTLLNSTYVNDNKTQNHPSNISNKEKNKSIISKTILEPTSYKLEVKLVKDYEVDKGTSNDNHILGSSSLNEAPNSNKSPPYCQVKAHYMASPSPELPLEPSLLYMKNYRLFYIRNTQNYPIQLHMSSLQTGSIYDNEDEQKIEFYHIQTSTGSSSSSSTGSSSEGSSRNTANITTHTSFHRDTATRAVSPTSISGSTTTGNATTTSTGDSSNTQQASQATTTASNTITTNTKYSFFPESLRLHYSTSSSSSSTTSTNNTTTGTTTGTTTNQSQSDVTTTNTNTTGYNTMTASTNNAIKSLHPLRVSSKQELYPDTTHSSNMININNTTISAADVSTMFQYLPLVCTQGFPYFLLYKYIGTYMDVERNFWSQLDPNDPNDVPRGIYTQMIDSYPRNDNELLKWIKLMYSSVNNLFATTNSPASTSTNNKDTFGNTVTTSTTTTISGNSSTLVHHPYVKVVNESNPVYIKPSEVAVICIMYQPTPSSFQLKKDPHTKLAINEGPNIKKYILLHILEKNQQVIPKYNYQIMYMRQTLYCNEMTLLQKNINFGKIILGGSVSRFVTIVNKSNIPCLYSISKSGSISSGFLKIPKGRRGWIKPYSSSNIDFIFKPTLSGHFEEILKIDNITNMNDSHSIVIKAKVTKPDTFQLYAHPQDEYSIQVVQNSVYYELGQRFIAATTSEEHTSLSAGNGVVGGGGSSTSGINSGVITGTIISTKSDQPDSSRSMKGDMSLSNTIGNTNESMMMTSSSSSSATMSEGVKPFNIGELTLGETSDVMMTFRLKNVTNKVRQFIIDATHMDAISLCPPIKTLTQVESNEHLLATTTTTTTTTTSDSVTSPVLPINDMSLLNDRLLSQDMSEEDIHKTSIHTHWTWKLSPHQHHTTSIRRVSINKGSDDVADIVKSNNMSEMNDDLDTLSLAPNQDIYVNPHQVPFEPLPEILQSIIGVHCRFELLPYEADRSGMHHLSAEDKQKLEDKLEHFKQKLKIAKRKQRLDKQVKYEKKIKEISELLHGNKMSDNFSEITNDTEEDPHHTATFNSSSHGNTSKFSPIKSQQQHQQHQQSYGSRTSNATNTTNAMTSPQTTCKIVGASDVAFHVKVEPEQSVIIKIKITLLPSTHYRSWIGALPFRGFFRVYECRNEDCVKKIRFHAFVSSPQRKSSFPLVSSRLPSMEFISSVNNNTTTSSNNHATTAAAASSSTDLIGYYGQNISSEGNEYILDPSFEDVEKKGIFLVTISPWSSYATRHLYPYYRFNPLNILGMSIKMTQASKERILYASFSVSSLIPEEAILKIFLIEEDIDYGDPSQRYGHNIKFYRPSYHGNISFAAYHRFPTLTGDSNEVELIPSSSKSSPKRRMSNTPNYFEVSTSNTSNIPTNMDQTSLHFNDNHMKHEILASGTLECVVKWQPPDDLPKEEFMVTSIGLSMILPGSSHLSTTTAQLSLSPHTPTTTPNTSHITNTNSIATASTGTGVVSTMKSPTITGRAKSPIRHHHSIHHHIHIGDQILHSQIIPMVCFLEHKSSFTVDRYVNFGDVPMGSDRLQKITITNLSETEEFHYLLIPSSATITTTNTTTVYSVGKVNVLSGQHMTGVLLPLQSKEITLIFSATSMGKFDQEIWINNLNDHFDQKRTVVSAIVTIPQSLLISFPDLSYDEDERKYDMIDLGQIQLVDPYSLSLYKKLNEIKPESECIYKLRLINVSDKIMVLTAVSNLKRQCFIYTDSTLKNLIISMILPRKIESILYIVVRPSLSVLENAKMNTMNSTTNTTTIGSGSHTLSSNSSFTLPKKDSWSSNAYDKQALYKGRELSGGIRLVFYELNCVSEYDEDDLIDDDVALVEEEVDNREILDTINNEYTHTHTWRESPYNSEVVSNTTEKSVIWENIQYDLTTLKKLFETTITFKVMVGMSNLVCRPSYPIMKYIPIISKSKSIDKLVQDSSSNITRTSPSKKEKLTIDDILYCEGEYTLENTSITFALTYQYLVHDSVKIVPLSVTSKIGLQEMLNEYLIRGDMSKIILLILDSSTATILPTQIKTIKYYFFSNITLPGLSLQNIRFINKSTGEEKSFTLSAYFSRNMITIKPRPSYIKTLSPTSVLLPVSSHTLSPTTSPPSRSPLTLPLSLSEDISTLSIQHPSTTTTTTTTTTTSSQQQQQPLSPPTLPVIEFATPIWIHSNAATSSTNTNTTMKSSQHTTVNTNTTTTMNTAALSVICYHVIGPKNKLIGEWEIFNASTTSVMVTPVSDLPITITFTELSRTPSTTSSPHRRTIVKLIEKTRKGLKDDTTSHTSLLSLSEKGILKKCGNAISIASQGRLCMSIWIDVGCEVTIRKFKEMISKYMTSMSSSAVSNSTTPLVLSPHSTSTPNMSITPTIIGPNATSVSSLGGPTAASASTTTTNVMKATSTYINTTLENGQLLHTCGIVGLLSSTQSLKKFFDPSFFNTPEQQVHVHVHTHQSSSSIMMNTKSDDTDNNGTKTSLLHMFHTAQSTSSLPTDITSISNTSHIIGRKPFEHSLSMPLSTSQSSTPLVDDITDNAITSARDHTNDTYLPLEFFTYVHCSFLCPKMHVQAKSLDLGTLPYNYQKEFELTTITNHCDDTLIIKLYNLPTWLHIHRHNLNIVQNIDSGNNSNSMNTNASTNQTTWKDVKINPYEVDHNDDEVEDFHLCGSSSSNNISNNNMDKYTRGSGSSSNISNKNTPYYTSIKSKLYNPNNIMKGVSSIDINDNHDSIMKLGSLKITLKPRERIQIMATIHTSPTYLTMTTTAAAAPPPLSMSHVSSSSDIISPPSTDHTFPPKQTILEDSEFLSFKHIVSIRCWGISSRQVESALSQSTSGYSYHHHKPVYNYTQLKNDVSKDYYYEVKVRFEIPITPVTPITNSNDSSHVLRARSKD